MGECKKGFDCQEGVYGVDADRMRLKACKMGVGWLQFREGTYDGV